MTLESFLLILALVSWMIILGSGLVLYVTSGIWLPKLLSRLAKRDIFVTNVEEGTGKMIMKSGKAWRFITASPNTDPDDDRDITKKNKKEGLWNKEGQKESFWIEWIDDHLPGGMRFIGWLPFIYKIHWYNFRWSVLRDSEPASNEVGLVGTPRKIPDSNQWVASFSQRLNYIYLRDSDYYFEISGAQTAGSDCEDPTEESVGLPVTLHLTMTMRLVDPYLTYFQVHDWLQTVFDRVGGSIRWWISTQTIEGVVTKYETLERKYDAILQSTGVPDKLIEPGDEKPKNIVEYVQDTYGVRIKQIVFRKVVPPKEYVQATILRASAAQERIRIQIGAKAEAERLELTAVGQAKHLTLMAAARAEAMTIEADGEAKRIVTVAQAIKDGGPDALTLRGIEALENVGKHGNMVVVGGNTPVQMLLDTAKNRQPAVAAVPEERP